MNSTVIRQPGGASPEDPGPGGTNTGAGPSTSPDTGPGLDHPAVRASLRLVRQLVGAYLALSVATLAAVAALHGHPNLVTPAVWVRGTIVVASALLTAAFARRAAGGSARAYLRLRLVTAIMLVAVVAIVALPGTFRVWMKVEQSVCGLLLLAVVVVANRPGVRAAFADRRGGTDYIGEVGV